MRIELALAASLLLVATPAYAEPTAHDRAAESFQQARAAFARREFTAAAAAFEQAAEYEPHPVAWLNAAEAWAKADEPTKAATDCDRVLDDPASAAVHREEAQARLKVLGRRVATLQITGAPGSRASLDGGPPFALPARRRTTAGTHAITLVELPSQRIEITARLGEVLDVDARPPTTSGPLASSSAASSPVPTHGAVAPDPAARDAVTVTGPQPAPSRSIPTVTWVALGGAALAAGATTVFAIRTGNAKSEFLGSPSEATRDSFYRERLATNVSLAIAVAAVGVGIAFWLLSPSEPPRGVRAARAAFHGITFGP